jgi:hypothetical protein
MAYVAAFAAGGASAYQAWQEYQFAGDEADAYRAAGKRTLAAGTREFQEAEREREFMYSRALALAAASGAGVDDPGMVKVLGDLQAEGLYQSLSKLWRAQNDAEGAYFRAEAAEREQKAIRTLAPLRIVTSAYSAYATAGGSIGGTAVSSPTISAGGMSPVPPGSQPKSILDLYRG